MTTARIFRLTVSTKWYDEIEGCAQEYELHFIAARRGKIRDARKYLWKRGVEFFQSYVYKETGRLIPKAKIRVEFEREEPTSRAERDIKIETRRMRYRGREWKSKKLPSKTIPYVKEVPFWKLKLTEFADYVKKGFRRLFGR